MLIVASAVPLGHAGPDGSDPGLPVEEEVEECSPAVGISGWQNTTYSAAENKWTGEREVTLACVKPENSNADNPCKWCYQIKIERKWGPLWQQLNADEDELSLGCDDATIGPHGSSWEDLVNGTEYRVRSRIAAGSCGSGNLNFDQWVSYKFTAE